MTYKITRYDVGTRCLPSTIGEGFETIEAVHKWIVDYVEKEFPATAVKSTMVIPKDSGIYTGTKCEVTTISYGRRGTAPHETNLTVHETSRYEPA
jgi:hypothetical protein